MERKQTYLRAVHCNNPFICDPVYGTDFPQAHISVCAFVHTVLSFTHTHRNSEIALPAQ